MLTTMKIRHSAVALFIAALALTGCTPSPSESAAPTVPPAATPSSSPSSDAAAEPTTSDRGNVIKAVGDTFGLSAKDGSSVASFVVNAITVDPGCTSEYAEAPEHGHFVRLDVSGETTATLPDDLYFASGSWFVVADNGTTFNGDVWSMAAAACMDQTERLPNIIGAGERVTGAVILDVPTPHGVIILQSPGSGGWEWEY